MKFFTQFSKKILSTFLILNLLVGYVLTAAPVVRAGDDARFCRDIGGVTVDVQPPIPDGKRVYWDDIIGDPLDISISGITTDTSKNYYLEHTTGTSRFSDLVIGQPTSRRNVIDGVLSWSIRNDEFFSSSLVDSGSDDSLGCRDVIILLRHHQGSIFNDDDPVCKVAKYEICDQLYKYQDQATLKIFQKYTNPDGSTGNRNNCFAGDEGFYYEVTIPKVNGQPFKGDIEITLPGSGTYGNDIHINDVEVTDEKISGGPFTFGVDYSRTESYPFELLLNGEKIYTYNLTVDANCDDVKPEDIDPNTNSGGPSGYQNSNNSSDFNICAQIPKNRKKDRDACCQCATGNASAVANQDGKCTPPIPRNQAPGLWTGLGCIKASQEGIVSSVIRIGLGLSGGLALLMILSGGFLMSTSQGDMKRVTQAKDLITSAIMGLLFIIFSVTILQFVGVNILKLPGFGQQTAKTRAPALGSQMPIAE